MSPRRVSLGACLNVCRLTPPPLVPMHHHRCSGLEPTTPTAVMTAAQTPGRRQQGACGVHPADRGLRGGGWPTVETTSVHSIRRWTQDPRRPCQSGCASITRLAGEHSSHAQVLQDAGRRRQYDAARSASPSGPYSGYNSGYGGSSSSSGGGFQPDVDSDDFEEAFRKWWEKAGGKCALFAAPCAAACTKYILPSVSAHCRQRRLAKIAALSGGENLRQLTCKAIQLHPV